MNVCAAIQTTASTPYASLSSNSDRTPNNRRLWEFRAVGAQSGRRAMGRITMRDRSKNRKPLQRGRSLSIEAIQTVQSLKRAKNDTDDGAESLERIFNSQVRRLLKLDMIAVLRELLRQNECILALKVFEDMRKEHWYKPQVSLYAKIISVLGNNGLFEKAEYLFMELKMENSLDPDIQGFNALFESLTRFNNTQLATEGFYLMKSIGCEPDKSTFKILINGLESKRETSLSAILRQEAQNYYGGSLNFLEEKE